MDLLAYATAIATDHARKLMENPGLAERLDQEIANPLSSPESVEAVTWSKDGIIALLHMHAARFAKEGKDGTAFDLRMAASWVKNHE